MKVKSLQQATIRLQEAKEERKALDREINDLRYLIADLSDSPLRKDFRERDRKIYLDWKKNMLKGKKGWQYELWEKYGISSERLREIYKQQKALREIKRAGGNPSPGNAAS